jgi:hypothetical protein
MSQTNNQELIIEKSDGNKKRMFRRTLRLTIDVEFTSTDWRFLQKGADKIAKFLRLFESIHARLVGDANTEATDKTLVAANWLDELEKETCQ